MASLRPGRCLLTYYLKQARMTQEEFADHMGVSQSLVSQIANNKKEMTYTFALNAAHLFGVRMEDLYRIVTHAD